MIVGELRWVEFPARGGHAQAGRRPAIVAQQTDALSTVLLIPLTTQRDALRFPGTVLVEPDRNNGLRQVSVALVFQLAAVDRRFIGNSLGQAAPEVMAAIWAALDDLTGRA